MGNSYSAQDRQRRKDQRFSTQRYFQVLIIGSVRRFHDTNKTRFQLIAPVLSIAIMLQAVRAIRYRRGNSRARSRPNRNGNSPHSRTSAHFYTLPIAPPLLLLNLTFRGTIFSNNVADTYRATNHASIRRNSRIGVITNAGIIRNRLRQPLVAAFNN